MKKLIPVLIVLALLLLPSAALAEAGDAAATTAFTIDTQHIYPGMDKSYAQGYLPTVEDGTAAVVLPLTVSGSGLCDTVTASLDLGDPSAAPFVFKNYMNDFAWGTYATPGGDASCCLVNFSLALRADRVNGSYPVVVHAEGTTRDGAALAADFTLYVVVSDGKSAGSEASPDTGNKPQPKLLVEGFTCSAQPLEAGAEAVLTVTVKNTSTAQTVKNIKLSFEDTTGEILPAATGSVYIAQIKKGQSGECAFGIRVAENASARTHVLTITMEYENSDATAFTSTDTIVLDVTQPVRLEYEQPALPARVTEGDNVAFSMDIMNLGKGTVYNVLLTFAIPGLNNGGSILVGNLPPGEAKEAATNLLVSSMNGEYGDAAGTILLSYEDMAGERFEREIAVQTRIEKKAVPAATQTQQTQDKAGGAVPWWAWGIGGVALLAAALLFLLSMTKGRRQREIDERTL